MAKAIEVIGVAGQKQNGKDTLTDILTSMLGWERHSFAYAVKKIYCDAFDKDFDFIERWKVISEPPVGMLKNVRESLQFIGDGFRDIQPDIWITTAFREPEMYRRKVMSDLRYVNEAIQVKKKNGFNFLIYRPGMLNNDPNRSESQIRPYVEWCESVGKEGLITEWPEYQAAVQGETSEFFRDLSNFDYFIRNEGTIYQLGQKVQNKVIPLIKERCNENTCR